MSKTSVGDVYAKVIHDVCDHSRQDFEEGGVELATLDLLKSEWQKKLSGLKVAQLPWDPPPPAAIKEATPLPSNAKPIPQTLPSNGNVNTPPPQAIPSAPPIKHEANNSYPPQAQPQQSYQVPSFPQGQPMSARDRAAMNLHQTYGQRAGPQIAQLQSNQPRVPPLQPSASLTSNNIKQEDQQSDFAGVQDYGTDTKPQSSASVKSGQNDGAGDAHDDWRTEYNRRKALAQTNGGDGDHLMRAQFLAKQKELEAGGLLSILEERHVPAKAITRKLNALTASSTVGESSSTLSLTRAQGDATGDDDDAVDDEDAINSDLDDPDDLALNEEDGENTDQVMLCTYDKVQRVKNKWKCTLKDGILRVEGNEYVFHKGQGEFEW